MKTSNKTKQTTTNNENAVMRFFVQRANEENGLYCHLKRSQMADFCASLKPGEEVTLKRIR